VGIGSRPLSKRLWLWINDPDPIDRADKVPEKFDSTAVTQKGFTQHEHLNSLKLIHMNGRGFDPLSGRFLSVDPVIQFPLNSQSMNPYSYILNNPMAGVDPTGYAWMPAEQCPGGRGCDIVDRRSILSKSPGSEGMTGSMGALRLVGNGASRQGTQPAARTDGVSSDASSLLANKLTPNSCPMSEPHKGEARPLKFGEHLQSDFEYRIDKLPVLGDGGKDLLRLVIGDLYEAGTSAVDGNFGKAGVLAVFAATPVGKLSKSPIGKEAAEEAVTGVRGAAGTALNDFNQARNAALEWLQGRGFKAEQATLGKFGANAGTPIGMKSADGKSGFRIEFDERHGAHINVWSGKQKHTFTFDGNQSMVDRLVRQFIRE
jgi:RHS repeat-associated protein